MAASITHLLITFLLTTLFFIVFLKKRFLSKTPHQKLPPSPRKLPLIGNLHQLGKLPHRSLQSLSKRYGELMLLHFGRVPVIIASSPKAAAEIMKTNDLIFSNRPKLIVPDKLTYGSKDVSFAPYGEYWRQIKSISKLHLLSTARVRSYRNIREEETSLMLEKIRAAGEIVNLSDVFVSMTNDVVCRAALGRKYGGEGVEGMKFKRMLDESVELLVSTCVEEYVPWLSWIDRISGLDSRVAEVARMFDEFLEGVVEEHRRNEKEDDDDKGGSYDFVDILLKLQRENVFDFLDDNAIKAIVMDMFAGGTDTTAAVLTWTMSELIGNPRAMKALQSELRQLPEIKEEDLDEMRYLKAAIKESLRLHAPVPLLVPRESTQPTRISGYDVPAGTRAMVNVWAICRDPSIWKDPESFYPERFLDSSEEVEYKGLHFEFVPFGSGRRGCPGVVFASNVVELALARLVHGFDFALPNGESIDMSEVNGITVRKRLPLLVVPSSSHH